MTRTVPREEQYRRAREVSSQRNRRHPVASEALVWRLYVTLSALGYWQGGDVTAEVARRSGQSLQRVRWVLYRVKPVLYPEKTP